MLEQLEEVEGGHVLAGGQLGDALASTCRFMHARGTLTDFNQHYHVNCAPSRCCAVWGDAAGPASNASEDACGCGSSEQGGQQQCRIDCRSAQVTL
jgi:hypothetical protein